MLDMGFDMDWNRYDLKSNLLDGHYVPPPIRNKVDLKKRLYIRNYCMEMQKNLSVVYTHPPDMITEKNFSEG